MYFETGNITIAAPLNSKRRAYGIGILNLQNHDRVVVFGGVDPVMKTVEVYMTENDTWEMTDIELQEKNYQFGFLTSCVGLFFPLLGLLFLQPSLLQSPPQEYFPPLTLLPPHLAVPNHR